MPRLQIAKDIFLNQCPKIDEIDAFCTSENIRLLPNPCPYDKHEEDCDHDQKYEIFKSSKEKPPEKKIVKLNVARDSQIGAPPARQVTSHARGFAHLEAQIVIEVGRRKLLDQPEIVPGYSPTPPEGKECDEHPTLQFLDEPSNDNSLRRALQSGNVPRPSQHKPRANILKESRTKSRQSERASLETDP
ncbi:hypothetical protein ACFE04_026824 [Oxalis oulophora]